MSRLVVTYPNWACQVVGSQAAIDINNALCTAVLGIGVSFDPASITAFRDFGSGPALTVIVVIIIIIAANAAPSPN